MTSRGKNRQKGYILALNIAVLTLMLIGATYMGHRMSVARDLARAEQARLSAEYLLESARAKIFFMLATVPRGLRGLGLGSTVVSLDGRYYRLGERVLVSLQDTRGLVALNGVTTSGFGRERIERLLGTYGIDALEASRMTDALLDYRDADDLRRLNGAEREDYLRGGKSESIRNADLLNVGELARILNWPDKKQIWGKDPIVDHVSAMRLASFNPNTADWRALVAVSGISAEFAQSLVASRRSGEIEDIAPLVFSGALNDPFGPNALVTLFPAPTVIIKLKLVGLPWGYRITMAHTPEIEYSPWRVESFERISVLQPDPNLDKLPALPGPDELLSSLEFKSRVQ